MSAERRVASPSGTGGTAPMLPCTCQMPTTDPPVTCDGDGYTETWNDDQSDVVVTLCTDPVWVRFECGHRAFIDRAEYGDGSAMCGGCGEFQTYARCLTCGSLDCQSWEGPTVGHA